VFGVGAVLLIAADLVLAFGASLAAVALVLHATRRINPTRQTASPAG
jgi:hypothetical protein